MAQRRLPPTSPMARINRRVQPPSPQANINRLSQPGLPQRAKSPQPQTPPSRKPPPVVPYHDEAGDYFDADPQDGNDVFAQEIKMDPSMYLTQSDINPDPEIQGSPPPKYSQLQPEMSLYRPINAPNKPSGNQSGSRLPTIRKPPSNYAPNYDSPLGEPYNEASSEAPSTDMASTVREKSLNTHTQGAIKTITKNVRAVDTISTSGASTRKIPHSSTTTHHRKILASFTTIDGDGRPSGWQEYKAKSGDDADIGSFVESLEDNYPGILDSMYEADQDDKFTLLHRIAGPPAHNFTKFYNNRFELLNWLMGHHPELYNKKDDSGYTPFVHVIKLNKGILTNGRNKFIEYYVQVFPKLTADQLNDHLSCPYDQNLSLIHAVIPMICDDTIQGISPLGELFEELTQNTLCSTDRDKNTVLHKVVQYKYVCDESPESQMKLLNQLKQLLSRPDIDTTKLISAKNKSGQSPYLHRRATRQEMTENDKSSKVPDIIEEYLKGLCLEDEKLEDSVLTLLYDKNEKPKTVSLDLQELATETSIPQHTMEAFLKNHFEFETILRKVIIPRLAIAPFQTPAMNLGFQSHRPKGPTPRGRLVEDSGRQDCRIILCLLKEQGVKKILKLVVDDDTKPPHTDETIINILADLDIQDLDWKKWDLCSETISKAAPKVKQLTLYWSGNNTTLRSWSAVDGLNNLESLRGLYVITNKEALETRATINMNINAFKTRMEQNCSRTNLQIQTKRGGPYERGGSASKNYISAGQSAIPNAWLETMDSFANFIRNISDTASELPQNRKRIKVAVIDDGLDFVTKFEQFGPTIHSGMSFSSKQYFRSTMGHGTIMAEQIHRICPKVKLCIARLDELPSQRNQQRMQPTPQSAARAIEWAIDQDVDIISMSWTVKKRGSSDLQDQITKASQRNILMFAAASDQGLNVHKDEVYPSSDRNVFCIGPADDSGQGEPTALNEAQYFFPGADSTINDKGIQVVGSSFATALASGMAALILDCVEIAGYGQYRRKIRTYEQMNRILSSMTYGGHPYILASKYFSKDMEYCNWDAAGKERLDKIMRNILHPTGVLNQSDEEGY